MDRWKMMGRRVRHYLFKELVLVTFPRIPPIPPPPSKEGDQYYCPLTPTPTSLRCSWRWFFYSEKMTILEVFDMYSVKIMVLGQYLVSALNPPQRKVTSTDVPERRYLAANEIQ